MEQAAAQTSVQMIAQEQEELKVEEIPFEEDPDRFQILPSLEKSVTPVKSAIKKAKRVSFIGFDPEE